jgi:hypothetical protein
VHAPAATRRQPLSRRTVAYIDSIAYAGAVACATDRAERAAAIVLVGSVPTRRHA